MNEQQQNDFQPEEDNLNADNVSDTNTTGKDTDAIYFGDSSLQTKEEFEHDKKADHSKEDNKVTASDVDDLQLNSDGAAGTDQAGTAERKSYGDIQLNKGLESQAMDEES